MKKNLLALICAAALSAGSATYAFDGPPPPPGGEFGPPPAGHHKMDKKGPDHAKIDARLKLTAEQKAQLEKNRLADKKKLDPIMKKMFKKHNELRALRAKQNPTVAEQKKMVVLQNDMKVLRGKADKIRKANMQQFEAILTPEQSKEFAKIKEEHRAKMEAQRKKMAAERKVNPKKFDGKRPPCPPDGECPPPPGEFGPPPMK